MSMRTIGENSQPIVSRADVGGAAVNSWTIARTRRGNDFEQLKCEMIGRGAAADLVRKDGSEI